MEKHFTCANCWSIIVFPGSYNVKRTKCRFTLLHSMGSLWLWLRRMFSSWCCSLDQGFGCISPQWIKIQSSKQISSLVSKPPTTTMCMHTLVVHESFLGTRKNRIRVWLTHILHVEYAKIILIWIHRRNCSLQMRILILGISTYSCYRRKERLHWQSTWYQPLRYSVMMLTYHDTISITHTDWSLSIQPWTIEAYNFAGFCQLFVFRSWNKSFFITLLKYWNRMNVPSTTPSTNFGP